MVSLAILLLGLASWPIRPAKWRTSTLRGRRSRTWSLPPYRPFLVCSAAAAAGWLAFGPGGAVAGAIAGVAGRSAWQSRIELRRGITELTGLAEGMRSLAGELRAGSPPAAAAHAAAADAPPGAAETMRAIAVAAHHGGNVERDIPVARLGNAWGLAQRHGVPLADVLDAVVRDLDQRSGFARQAHAGMAGPRSSAAVLTLLPLVGIALGTAMGANPVRVLADTGAGQALLVVGTALICAGALWSARLTRGAVLR